jgi:hypothetical protein
MGQPTGVGYDGVQERRARSVSPENLLPAPYAVSAAKTRVSGFSFAGKALFRSAWRS